MTLRSNKKVFTAMSGGVDSSVAAALLQQQGYQVTGVFFKPWQPDTGRAFCNWQQDRQDALAVATKLGIEFQTWDFSQEYGKYVTQYMIEAYRNGITPNPDVMCNKEIKFGLFLKRALAEGADYIATGHYARIRKTTSKKHDNVHNIYHLLKAKDGNKDQSYFLYTLTQTQLRYCLFPIGNYTKPNVRAIARKLKLITYNKKDSQGVCFVGKLDMKQFLATYIPRKQGDVVLHENDTIIGHHDGAAYYTIGQRHGFILHHGDGPYYVQDKNMATNTIYVTKEQHALEQNTLRVGQITWTRPYTVLPKTVMIRTRYRAELVPGTITVSVHNTMNIITKKKIRAITPGQSVVLYSRNEILGGGTIINNLGQET